MTTLAKLQVLLVALSACVQDGTVGTEHCGELDDTQCLRRSFCEAALRCDPLFPNRYQSFDDCVKAEGTNDPLGRASLMTPTGVVHPKAAAECAQYAREASCGHFAAWDGSQFHFIPHLTFWPDDIQAACFGAFGSGTTFDGQSCQWDHECQSTYCNTVEDVCEPRHSLGEDCMGDVGFWNDCARGLVCQITWFGPSIWDWEGECVNPTTLGESCSDDQPCLAPAQCLGEPPVCRLATAGEPCDATQTVNYEERTCASGFVCLWSPGQILGEDYLCHAAEMVEDGELCADHAQCLSGADCWDPDSDPTTYQSRCTPPGAVGDPCVEFIDANGWKGANSGGNRCQHGLRCAVETDENGRTVGGTCQPE